MDGKAIKYPIYIVSKGRWENPLTARYFIQDGITDFNIVVEPQEYDNYCKAVGANRVLKTDFSNLGLGSYPARNFAWEHSIKNGFETAFHGINIKPGSQFDVNIDPLVNRLNTLINLFFMLILEFSID